MFKHSHRRPSPVRRSFSLAEVGSKRLRDPAVAAVIARDGGRVRAFEIQGHLGFPEAEQVTRAVLEDPASLVVLDLRRVHAAHPAAIALLAGLGPQVRALSAAPEALVEALGVPAFDELDRALEWCEDWLTGDTEAPALIGLSEHPVLRGISADEFALLERVIERGGSRRASTCCAPATP